MVQSEATPCSPVGRSVERKKESAVALTDWPSDRAGLLQPPRHVAAADPPRNALGRRANAEEDAAVGLLRELEGDLAAGLAAADDQDVARRQEGGVAVL